MQPYISKLTGDLVIEESVQSRRLTDPGWARRNRRSRGANKQFRARVRANHEAMQALKEMAKEAEKKGDIKSSSFFAGLINSVLPKKLVRGLVRGRKG